ncbi:hypothetical protein L7F22_052039 [Adiantum nelumboides]|nr:hypothetical protein [Adiantum nelumboides]
MNAEFSSPLSNQLEQMFQAVSSMLMQVNHTNQTLINFMASNNTPKHHTDSKVRPKSFSGLPTEDILTWLDHFANVVEYHQWNDTRKAMEVRTLLEGVAATWFVQEGDQVKGEWHILKSMLIQNFAHQNITQSALQQLNALKQQQHEPVAQFAVKMNQLLIRADPAMSKEMKLFFLWPRLRHDIARRVRDQGPTSFHAAIQIAQRIEGNIQPDTAPLLPTPTSMTRIPPELPTPMDIDVQNTQLHERRNLPDRDPQGRPRCFACNNYGHIRRYCRNRRSR